MSVTSIFSFGKKRRTHRSRKVKGSRKLPAKVLRMCKKYRVKATKKVGRKRVYRSASLLMKLCKRKMRLKKRKMSKRKARKSRFGASCSPMKQVVEFGRRRRSHRRSRLGGMHMMPNGMMMKDSEMMFGRSHRRSGLGNMMKPMMHNNMMDMEFGKKRRVKSVSKSAAMKAFKRFYLSHCKPVLRRRTRFGVTAGTVGGGYNTMNPMNPTNPMNPNKPPLSTIRPPKPPSMMMPNKPYKPMFGRRRRARYSFGIKEMTMSEMKYGRRRRVGRPRRTRFGAGNPPLSSSMGYEFCSNGGGVLEGSGLYAQGCTPAAEAAAAFGKSYRRRRVVRRRVVRRRRVGGRYRKVVGPCAGLKKAQCKSSANCRYVKRRGCKGRAGTRKGVVYEGPSGAPGFGRRRRRVRRS